MNHKTMRQMVVQVTKRLYPEHRCPSSGECAFCDGINQELLEKGLIAIPFDHPGAYEFTNDDPNLLIVKVPAELLSVLRL